MDEAELEIVKRVYKGVGGFGDWTCFLDLKESN